MVGKIPQPRRVKTGPTRPNSPDEMRRCPMQLSGERVLRPRELVAGGEVSGVQSLGPSVFCGRASSWPLSASVAARRPGSGPS
ncbi:hypothetical protein MRX96_021509 [Rhipicephalus microplus]